MGKKKIFHGLKDDFAKHQNNESTPYNFCTIAGEKYVIKVLAFYHSLVENCKHFHLWILCMDNRTKILLQMMDLNNVTLIHLSDVEDEDLKRVKETRKQNEYCWTLKAPLISYVQEKYNINTLVYCDSDVYLFSDPKIIFQNLEKYSVYLCPQRDLDYVELNYGKYQAGVIGFKNDEQGKSALNYWKLKCIEWCEWRVDKENDRFGDQKYLDKIPSLYKNVYVETHLGVNAAPWNSVYGKDYKLYTKDEKHVSVEEDEMILFHFACISIFSDTDYDLWSLGRLDIPRIAINYLYMPYIHTLQKAIDQIIEIDSLAWSYMYHEGEKKNAKTPFSLTEITMKESKYDDFYYFCSIVSNEYAIKALALYNSLEKEQQCYHIYFYAIDSEVFELLTNLHLEHATIINLYEIHDNNVIDVAKTRNKKEFCWSLKGWFMEYILDFYELKKIVYLDCDQFFFSKAKHLFSEWEQYSFLMCTQRAPAPLEANCGIYQAGLLGVKNDDYGRKILTWWKEQCLKWCYESHDYANQRWGDQKYLDRIPHMFGNIKIITNIGINAAPWNIILNDKSYSISKENERVFINNTMICTYHFGSLDIYENSYFDVWNNHPIKLEKDILNCIYQPYFKALKEAQAQLAPYTEKTMSKFLSTKQIGNAKNLVEYSEKEEKNKWKNFLTKIPPIF